MSIMNIPSVAVVFLLQIQLEPIDAKVFPKEVQTKSLTATVCVINASQKRQGSGTIIRQAKGEYYILTARHLVEGTEEVEVRIFTADTPPLPKKVHRTVRVLARAKGEHDLAILRLRTDDPAPGILRIAPDSKDPSNGTMLALGCSEGAAPTCRADKVEKKMVRREGSTEKTIMWESATSSAAGRSGGALLDQSAYLVGVASGISKGKAYYCHIDDIRAFLRANGLKWLYEEEK
ncbi:MAG: serine protease [Gemmataceae bacterium]|nr:serine protease [Gemmataceae bacterium]